MFKAMIISFGIDTIAKRGGLILLAISLMSLVGLCLYWHMARIPFVYQSHYLKWHVSPIPENNSLNSWLRFEERRETHKLDKACLEKEKNEKRGKADLLRDFGIYAEECVTDIIKDEPETVTKWNTSFDGFFTFLAKKHLISWIVGGLIGGIFLFSGFAEHLFSWTKTGHWPVNNQPKKVVATRTGVFNIGLHIKTLFVISWIMASVGFLAWMFYEDWYNASAAYIEVVIKVGLFAAFVWICKKAWYRIRRI